MNSTALAVAFLLLLLPVSTALQGSRTSDREQGVISEATGLASSLADLVKSFGSIFSLLFPLVLRALSGIAAGELRYGDVAWFFDIISIFAKELGLSQTYGAFVDAIEALTTGSLTVNDVYGIASVLPPLLREAPGAIGRWLSIAYNVGFEVVFAPIAGGVIGLAVGAVIGAIIFSAIIFFFFSLPVFASVAIAFALIGAAIAIFIVLVVLFGIIFFVLLFLPIMIFVIFFIIIGAVIGFIIGSIGGLIIGALVGLAFSVILALIFVFLIAAIIAVFLVLPLFFIVIVLIFAVSFIIGIVLALFLGLPVGITVGFIAFAGITVAISILFTIGYPLLRWASMTGAL